MFNPQPYLGSSGGVWQIDYPKLALSTYEIHLSNSRKLQLFLDLFNYLKHKNVLIINFCKLTVLLN